MGQTRFDFPINKATRAFHPDLHMSIILILSLFAYLVILRCIAQVMNSDFPFLYVCDLLEDLWGLHDPNRPQLLSREKAKKTSEKFIEWLKSHRDGLNACNKEDDPVSRMLRPESSMDRVNGMNAEKLERIIARVLRLPWKQVVELQKWRCGPPHGDLAACVEKVVEITDHVSISILISL